MTAADAIKDLMQSCNPNNQSMDKSILSTKETAKTMDESMPFTTHRKHPTKRKYRKHNTTPLNSNTESIADSMLSSNDFLVDLLGLKDLVARLELDSSGKHPHLSFDCPIKLREAFNEATHEQGSNVCDELQKHMVSYVIAYRAKKHAFGNTLSKLLPTEVRIGSVNLNQYTQGRVRRRAEAVVAPEPEVPIVPVCGVHVQGKPCGERAVIKATYSSGKEYFVCQGHYKSHVKANPRDWSNVAMLEGKVEEASA